MRATTLILIAALSGCAEPYVYDHVARYGPEPSEKDKRAAIDAIALCFSEKARVLDDRLSDAGTVGRSVAEACHQEGDRALELLTYADTEMQRAAAYRIWPQEMREKATMQVLKIRASRK